MGVLKAAANAAEHPTGTSDFTRSTLSPRRRASTEATPAPMCTDGPSRPSAMPLASDIEQQTNFPTTVRNVIKPSARKSANFV